MYLGVDIGGTKTLLVCFSKDGKKLDTIKFETPAIYEDFLAELDKNVAKLSTKNLTACVVAVPGKVDRKNGVGLAFGNLAWLHIPIQRDVKAIVNCPTLIENDANLGGLYEARLRPEYRRVLYITISTGIGGVIITRGSIDPATQDAEIGQMLLEYRGRMRNWEDFGSGRAFYEKFGKKVSEVDETDHSALFWLSRNIAVGLIDLIATLTPELIIFGGGAGAHYDKFSERLLEHLKIYENPLLVIPPIIKAERPEEAVIYGCYELAKDHYGKTS